MCTDLGPTASENLVEVNVNVDLLHQGVRQTSCPLWEQHCCRLHLELRLLILWFRPARCGITRWKTVWMCGQMSAMTVAHTAASVAHMICSCKRRKISSSSSHLRERVHPKCDGADIVMQPDCNANTPFTSTPTRSTCVHTLTRKLHRCSMKNFQQLPVASDSLMDIPTLRTLGLAQLECMA